MKLIDFSSSIRRLRLAIKINEKKINLNDVKRYQKRVGLFFTRQ